MIMSTVSSFFFHIEETILKEKYQAIFICFKITRFIHIHSPLNTKNILLFKSMMITH